MKPMRVAFATLVTLAAAFSTGAPGGAETLPARAPSVAPADEYFGPLKLSVLGIRNHLNDAASRLDRKADVRAEDALRGAQFVEKSLRDWERKYPEDTWLAPMLLALERVYEKIPRELGGEHADRVAVWLMERYPQSSEAYRLQAELADTAGR